MSGQSKRFLGLVLVLFSVVYLASCAVPPPTQELADAETAVQEARDMGAAECAPEELAAAEAALAKGRAWASEFCSELEARRMLIDARAKAEEAKVKCATVEEIFAELELRDIFFDFDRYNVRPDAAAVLQENAEVLAQNPDVHVVIEGYADVRGDAAYNLRLAQNRADSTRAFLVNMGVDSGRISTTSGGATQQFAAGSTEDAYQLNRRAHFVPTVGMSSIGARITIVRK